MRKLCGVTTTMDEEVRAELNKDIEDDSNGKWSRQQIRREIRDLKEIQKENSEMVSEVYEFIFEEEGVEGRSVIDDLMLLRTLYNNVSGFSAIIGFVIGVFTILVPVAVGLFKLYEYIIKWIFN